MLRAFILFFYISISFCTASDYYYFNTIQNSVGFTALGYIYYLQNPAQLDKIKECSISFSVKPSTFGLSELNFLNLNYLIKINPNIGFGADLCGISNNLYSELAPNLSLSYSLSDRFSFGISGTYNYLKIKDYGSSSYFELNFGAISYISDVISAGFVLRNVNRGYYSGGESNVYQTALCGLGISATKDLNFDIDALIRLSHSTGISISGKYNILEILALRLAYLTNPENIETGLNLKLSDNISLIYNFNFSMDLGSAHSCCVSYLW